MRDLLKKIRTIIAFNFRSILLFAVFYCGFTTITSLSLLNKGIGFALKQAGYSYLTAKNILPFLAKPYTLLVICGMLFVECVFAGIEMTSLLTLYQASLRKQKISLMRMLMGGFHKYMITLKKGFRQLPAINLLIRIFLTFLMAARLLVHVRPVNFILSEIWKHEIARYSFLILLILFIISMIPNLLLMQICFLERIPWKEGRKRSWAILKEHFFAIMPSLISINLLLILAIVVIYGVFAAGIATTAVLFTENKLGFAVLLRACDSMELILIAISSVVSVMVNHSCLTAAYYKYTYIEIDEEDLSTPFNLEKKVSKRAWIGSLVAIFLVYSFYVFYVVQSGTFLAKKAILKTQVTAHRGSSWNTPENTIPALEKAMEELADFSEIDVQTTQDGVVVLFHDSNLKRVTGKNEYLWNLTYEELSKLDAGMLFGAEYQYTKIPTLQEVLILSKGKMKLNIELKYNKRTPDLTEKVVELLHQYDFVAQCVISSTSLNYLKQVKELDPDIKTGYILSAAYGNYYEQDVVDFISIRSGFVSENMVNTAHEYGKEVHAWTVNSKSEMERMKLLSVDNIITDRPVYAREVLFQEEVTRSLFDYIKTIFK